jgi:hypothetical protein
MTTKPFDQFNKKLLQELLSPFGIVIPNLAVLGEERMIDVFFEPHPGVAPNVDELGVLVQQEYPTDYFKNLPMGKQVLSLEKGFTR